MTVRRSQGITNGPIAAEIGDKTARLIDSIYGAVSPNWQGGPELDFLPAEGKPAWETWRKTVKAEKEKIIPFSKAA